MNEQTEAAWFAELVAMGTHRACGLGWVQRIATQAPALTETAVVTQQQARAVQRADDALYDARWKLELSKTSTQEARDSLDMTRSAVVESLPQGEYVKRKPDASKVYKRGAYDRSTKRYSLLDVNDWGREIFVKRGTILFYGFDY